jgi:hypothetical protein
MDQILLKQKLNRESEKINLDIFRTWALHCGKGTNVAEAEIIAEKDTEPIDINGT